MYVTEWTYINIIILTGEASFRKEFIFVLA